MKKKKTKSVLATIITLVLGLVYQTYFAPKKHIKSQTSSKELVITRHARCRMKCRHIDMDEIKMVLRDGRVNHRKSEPRKQPCPVMAREAYSQAGKQQIRVISADCTNKQTIITVIDLSNEYNCYCE